MTCAHCTDSEDLFDLKHAKKDLRRFRKKGPNKATRLLIKMLRSQDVYQKTLLDIGGGIGAVQLELLRSGLNKATDVDASKGYLQMAKEEAGIHGYADSVEYLHGDFLDLNHAIENHDLVSLDKVICCYPNREELLENAMKRADVAIGLVFPHGNALSKTFAFLVNMYMTIKGSAFRTYAHSPIDVHQQLVSSGFNRKGSESTFIWKVWLYARN